MSKTGLLNPATTALLIVDYQERLMPHIHNKEEMIAAANKLIAGAGILDVPILVTEQYPKGLGHTVPEISLPGNCEVFEKICFSSMLSPEVSAQLKALGTRSVLIAGIEAHICVLKTALDAVEAGFDAHVVADAVSSRAAENKALALERMRQSGVFTVSVEMALFQLMDEAGSDRFKQISKLVK